MADPISTLTGQRWDAGRGRRISLLPAATLAIFLLGAALLGAAVPGYVDLLGDSYAKLMALPAVLVLGIALAYSRTALLLVIIATRASGDLAFDTSKFSLGGAQIGIGGLLNGFVILIALLLVLEKPDQFSRLIVRIWGAFLLALVIGVVITPDRGPAIRMMLTTFSTFAVFVGSWYVVRSPKDFRLCVTLILWSSVIPAAVGAYEFLSGTAIDFGDGGTRIRGTFSHPNILAFYLTLVISLLFYALKTQVSSGITARKVVMTLYLVFLFALLALTKTRSAWLACFAMFAAYGMFFERRYLAYIVVMGALALLIPGVADRVLDVTEKAPIISSLTPLNSFQWRVSLWESGLSWMQPARYLFGYGLQAFAFHATTFFAESGGFHWGAHSVFVELFFELGAIGLGAFLWMYGLVLRMLWKLLAIDRLAAFVLLILVVEYLVVSASDNMLDYLSFNWYLWFICGAGIALATKKFAVGQP